MALWQVSFVFAPKSLVGEYDEVPKQIYSTYFDGIDRLLPLYDLPANYKAQIATLLPAKTAWTSALEIWGDEASDDVQIWYDDGRVASVVVRIDVRKLDDALLSKFLTLADQWSCILVEQRYRRVCSFGLPQFRALLAGHPHSRAIRDPSAWLPVLAAEVKNNESA